MKPELFPQKLKRLREAKNWTADVLSAKTLDGDRLGVSPQGIKQAEAASGRVPEAETIEALALALGVEPSDFYEWPIAAARRDARTNPEAVQKRVADRLRKQARREAERREATPDTTPAEKRLKDRAP